MTTPTPQQIRAVQQTYTNLTATINFPQAYADRLEAWLSAAYEGRSPGPIPRRTVTLTTGATLRNLDADTARKVRDVAKRLGAQTGPQHECYNDFFVIVRFIGECPAENRRAADRFEERARAVVRRAYGHYASQNCITFGC